MVTSFFFDVGPEPVVGSWIAASLGPSSTPLTFSNQRNSSIRPPASRPSAPAARNHRRVETRLSAPTFASNGELDPQFRVTELVKPEKIVWRVLDDSTTDFVQDQTEWNDTEVRFEISENDGETEVRFTHAGLVPEFECFEACSTGWGQPGAY